MNNQQKKNNPPKQINNTKKGKVKYSLLTVVLIICIIQLIFSNMQNIFKNINYTTKIKHLKEKRNEELNRNKQLRYEAENYNSDKVLESIVRNNLKMADKDEVLILINKPKVQDKDKKTQNKTKKENQKAAD